MVPKTRKATSEAVTPGMKRRMSVLVLLTVKSGFPDAAMVALLLAWNRVKTMIATSKRL